MTRRCTIVGLLVCLALLPAAFPRQASGEDLSVWAAVSEAQRKSLREALQQECYTVIARREQAYEQIKTAEDLQTWQQQRRESFLRSLGTFPERGPLNAQVTGTLEGDGYRIEKIIFESQPRHHVTANLYLPDSRPPYPAVIIPCGHNFDGKAAENHQRVSILFARNGIAALCYDPIGQGERYQTFGPDGQALTGADQVTRPKSRQLEMLPGKPAFSSVEEHTLMGIGSILVGRNTATYRIFDGMRCIDYLLSRPDIDAKKIGCTGVSGGGTLTAYLMALDERIVCAAPGCYLTPFRMLLAGSGPQDAEQNIFGQLAYGMDQADYVLMRAPLPTCILAATRDGTFKIEGAWEIFREAKRAYARLDLPERVDLVETDTPHAFSTQLRVGAVRWMLRWLVGQEKAIADEDFPLWEYAQLQCTKEGQVMLMPGEQSVFDLNRAQAKRLKAQREEFWSKQSPDSLRQLVRKTANIRPLDALAPLQGKTVGTIARDGYRIEKRLLQDNDRLPLPALAFVPEKPSGEVYLYLHGEGKAADASPRGPIEELVRRGHEVLAVDLSGIGESALSSQPTTRRHWSQALFGPDGESFWLAYLLGKSLVGVRAEDALAAARYLQTGPDGNGTKRKVHVIGIGRAGLPALHAAALEPALFDTVSLRQTTSSWADVVQAPLGNAHLTETVHGVLGTYDLPDLVRLIGSQKVTIAEPITPR